MTQAPLTLRRWKRVEYDRLVDLGVFEGEPLELIGGQLIVAEPKGAYHSSAVSTARLARRPFSQPANQRAIRRKRGHQNARASG